MKAESRKPKAVSRATPRPAQLPRPAFRFPLSAFPPSRASRLAPRALTLIELLVTIVILVTLLAAVLPAVSPNNDGRKVREASRQLVSLFAQAQAQAARDGRAVGVGFRDTWTDADKNNVVNPGELTGMALEAYIIAEPPVFTGFSTGAAVRIHGGGNDNDPFGLNGNVPTLPNTNPPQPPLVNLVFGRGVGGEGIDVTDPSNGIPPQMFRGARMDEDGDIDDPGDIVEVGREVFEILSNDCDDVDDTDATPDVTDITDNDGVTYMKAQQVLTARWLSHRNRPLALLPRGGKAYRIRRAPSAENSPSRTAAETVQFPRGIGIDMAETKGNVVIGIVFSPNGTVDAYYEDGDKDDLDEPVFILLGRTENGHGWPGPNYTPPGLDLELEVYEQYDFRGTPTDPDDDVLAQRRREMNLFNPDSRWVTITPAGRVISSENAIFDPRKLLDDPNDQTSGRFVDNLSGAEIDQLRAQRDRYRNEAQRYARALESEGGG
jgi:type II secretory pathway pseudopilin PulG